MKRYGKDGQLIVQRESNKQLEKKTILRHNKGRNMQQLNRQKGLE